LEETRKWVNSVVLATEQGNKAASAGVEQASVAGECIQSLAQGVEESAHAATLVSTSSEQQTVAAELVAVAMANIEQTTVQNLEATGQLESAARRLEELAQGVTKLLSGYKI
ncbi:MAG: methyl-accepting chemotaxis protein, partial [Deltaproteobacteria bacterium]|nr:methyl-accepting chemotaxis protein [Deltaproteobacteria bacterium]